MRASTVAVERPVGALLQTVELVRSLQRGEVRLRLRLRLRLRAGAGARARARVSSLQPGRLS